VCEPAEPPRHSNIETELTSVCGQINVSHALLMESWVSQTMEGIGIPPIGRNLHVFRGEVIVVYGWRHRGRTGHRR
jgi:hypothetical protein